MARGQIKKVFPGGNTSVGFYSFFEYMAYPKREKIVVLKGGPGVGKSTFMRKVTEPLIDLGYDAEYHYCSADPSSLDGIYVPKLGVAVLDGTAPHVTDPKHPGVVDEMVNLGDYLNNDGMRPHRSEVIATLTERSRLFRRAYGNLSIATTYVSEIESYYQDGGALDIAGLNAVGRKLVEVIFADGSANLKSGVRRLFASAISPMGPINHLETIVAGVPKTYIIKGDMGTGKSTLVKKVLDQAIERGYYVEAYHCALNPQRIEHLVIPELGIVVVTSTKPHIFEPQNATMVVDTMAYVNEAALVRFKPHMDQARELYWAAVERGWKNITQAKKNHERLEELYVRNMDWDRVTERRQQILNEIMELNKK